MHKNRETKNSFLYALLQTHQKASSEVVIHARGKPILAGASKAVLYVHINPRQPLHDLINPVWKQSFFFTISDYILHLFLEKKKQAIVHGSLNVPIEHHPTIRYMVYNGYYKVMSNIPKMGQLPTPVVKRTKPRFTQLNRPTSVHSSKHPPTARMAVHTALLRLRRFCDGEQVSLPWRRTVRTGWKLPGGCLTEMSEKLPFG